MINVLLLYFSKVDWIEKHGQETKLPELNFSPRQLFWLSFARIWCNVNSDKAYHRQLRAPHAPPEFRVTGVVQNSHEFSKDFNCGRNSKMNPSTKCEVW